MEGEKYFKARIEKMKKSHADIFAAMLFRIMLVGALLIGGGFICNCGFQFILDHPEFDDSRK